MRKFFDTMNRYVHLFSSESEHSMWTASDAYLRDKWIRDDELAGPSHAVPDSVHGMTAPHSVFCSSFLSRLVSEPCTNAGES